LIVLGDFSPLDPPALELRGFEIELRGVDMYELGDALEACPGIRRTLYDDETGIAIACGGVQILSPGRGEAWILCDKTVQDHKAITIRSMRQVIADTASQWGLRRVEANVHALNPKARRMMKPMGFTLESIKPKYFPDGGSSYHFVLFPGE